MVGGLQLTADSERKSPVSSSSIRSPNWAKRRGAKDRPSTLISFSVRILVQLDKARPSLASQWLTMQRPCARNSLISSDWMSDFSKNESGSLKKWTADNEEVFNVRHFTQGFSKGHYWMVESIFVTSTVNFEKVQAFQMHDRLWKGLVATKAERQFLKSDEWTKIGKFHVSVTPAKVQNMKRLRQR